MFTKKSFKTAILLACLAVVSLSTMAQDPNFYIFLCFGQSNMEGQGTIENQDRGVDSRFQVLQAVNCTGQAEEQWRTAEPPICRCSSGLSPADYFGRTMVQNLPANVKVGIVHVAVAGCKIELFDKDQYANIAAGEAAWMQNIISEYGGNPYGRLVELAKIAQQDGVIKGILLHQGESNTGDSQWPNKVNKIYTDLLTDLSLNATDVPLLSGQVVDAAQGGQCASMNNIINSLPNTIPTAHVISSSGCTDQSDNLHFNSAGYRLLGERYADKMLDLLVPADYPIISITSPTGNEQLIAPADITITAEASDPDGTITKVDFYNGTELLASDANAPYSYELTDLAEGTYAISAVATDNSGNQSTAVVSLTVAVPQGPYNGIAHEIPGIVECEEYDIGGAGFAYYDDSEGTSVPDAPDFRTDEDVDIEICEDIQPGSTNGGYNIGFGTAGEWIEYTVNVLAGGTYDIEIRVACEGDGRTLSLSSDGNDLATDIAVQNTGGWQTWETLTVEDIMFNPGEQIIRLTIGDVDYVNLNKMTFVPVDVAKAPKVTITAPTEGGTTYLGVPVTISATATVEDATISSVQFVAKGATVGTDDTAPYSAEWTAVSTGDYTLTVTATADNGLSTSKTISVTVADAPQTVSLTEGWNLIGYPYEGESEISTALVSIWNQVEAVKDAEAFYMPDGNSAFNQLTSLSYGKGYFIKVKSACELSW